MNKTNAILGFHDQYSFLSNFTASEVEFEGMKFRTVEHAYVAAKTTNIQVREIIDNTFEAGKVKRIGKDLVLRLNWDVIKFDIMLELLIQKFSDPILLKKLLDTGERLPRRNKSLG